MDESVACEDRCDVPLERELNNAENQDDGPPGQCLKQEEDHELSSGVKFVIDPTGDKDAYKRFLAMDCTSDSDESSPYRSSNFIHLDPEPKEPAPVDLQPRNSRALKGEACC